MVPPFKEAVEACFVEGLVKVVFATETLALGINMPARTVVIEKLTKFTGERHEFLTPGQYTQLTGRAGPARHRRPRPRRGAVVAVRDLRRGRRRWRRAAASGSPAPSGPPTTWRPTWCAATRPTRPTGCSTCASPSTRPTPTWSGSSTPRPAPRETLDELRAEAACDRGDVGEYRALRRGRAGARRGLRPGDRPAEVEAGAAGPAPGRRALARRQPAATAGWPCCRWRTARAVRCG